MLRKLFLCVAIAFGCSFGCLMAAASESVDTVSILCNFNDFNYQKIFAEGNHGQLPETLGAALAPAFQQIGLNKFVSNITMIEQAACYSKSKMNSFLKKCAKTIKKAKLPKVHGFNADDVFTEFYAKEGLIICLSKIDDDIASIVVIAGNNNNITTE